MNTVQLHEERHPNDVAASRYESLIGIDVQKADLLDYLLRILAPDRVSRWLKKHHPEGLSLLARLKAPKLIVLAGEVGCGKTALATTVGTAVARALDQRVVVMETPSDIRGGGLVGQLSERVTAAFSEARVKAAKGPGILIIDEGDDLGTSRAQMQAHHEDRAGLNVLIKEIDRLARDQIPIAVLLVTNRLAALDPALVRRAHVIRFRRPDADTRRVLFERLLEGVKHEKSAVAGLVRASERQPAFSFSDLVERGAEAALLACLRQDLPFSASVLQETIERLEPTPLIEDTRP
jgi:AAA+ superfamily predicted ATPase